jgi:hypothetical protein
MVVSVSANSGTLCKQQTYSVAWVEIFVSPPRPKRTWGPPKLITRVRMGKVTIHLSLHPVMCATQLTLRAFIG